MLEELQEQQGGLKQITCCAKRWSAAARAGHRHRGYHERMGDAGSLTRPDLVRQGQRLEYFTIAYNSLEGLISIGPRKPVVMVLHILDSEALELIQVF